MIRQVHRAALVERHEQSFLGAADVRDGRRLADHVLGHDRGLGRLARHLVVILQRHDQHGVRVFLEFHEIGHAADDAAVGGFAERRLVDRAVSVDEPVIGPVEFAACLVAVRVGPAFVLRLQDAAGAVAQADQGGKAFAGQRAVGSQRRAAIDDGHALSADRLANACGRRRRRSCLRSMWRSGGGGANVWGGRFLGRGCFERSEMRQAVDRLARAARADRRLPVTL